MADPIVLMEWWGDLPLRPSLQIAPIGPEACVRMVSRSESLIMHCCVQDSGITCLLVGGHVKEGHGAEWKGIHDLLDEA